MIGAYIIKCSTPLFLCIQIWIIQCAQQIAIVHTHKIEPTKQSLLIILMVPTHNTLDNDATFLLKLIFIN